MNELEKDDDPKQCLYGNNEKGCDGGGMICVVALLIVSDTNSQYGNIHKIITIGATF